MVIDWAEKRGHCSLEGVEFGRWPGNVLRVGSGGGHSVTVLDPTRLHCLLLKAVRAVFILP